MNINADKQKRLPIFRERLNILKGHMTIDRLAEKVGVRRSTMGFYLAGQRLPKADDLKKIAVACNVSTDYLVGLTDAVSMDNHGISEATGLADEPINQLRQAKHDLLLRNTYDELIANGELVECIKNYLFSFLLDEIKNSRLRQVPTNDILPPSDKADLNLVKFIELLPTWRQEVINHIKHQPALLSDMMYEYVVRHLDEEGCAQVLGELSPEEEAYYENLYSGQIDEDEYEEPEPPELSEEERLANEKRMMEEAEYRSAISEVREEYRKRRK